MKRQDINLAVLHEGSSASMFQIANGEATLVLTSPPYFDEPTEILLRKPLRDQTDVDHAWRKLTAFASSLRPNFEEIGRVLIPGGYLVLQTKDIRYGEFLLPLADVHGELARNVGLHMRTRINWLATSMNPARRPTYAKHPAIGNFRALDTEQFLVFSKEQSRHSPDADYFDDALNPAWIEPLWRTTTARGARHPHGSPPEVVRRFIRLYTQPGDLIVEPFCGHGTTLIESARLGRRCIGYEIDRNCVERTLERLA